MEPCALSLRLSGYTVASGTPGPHTWKAVLEVTGAGGISATAEDTDLVNVCETPKVADIPNQTAPFQPFDLDYYLTYGGGLPVTWSVSDVPADWTVTINANNVVTVVAPEGAADPADITITASVECSSGVVCSSSDTATFTPNRPPVCTEAYATPSCLWPPNNKMVSISILGVTDPDGNPVTLTISWITSDEATASEKGVGGGQSCA